MKLSDYDYVIVNSSAGKDSQCMMQAISRMAQSEQYPRSRVIVAHADMGRMEWPGTRELAEYQASCFGFKFLAKARPQGDLLDHVKARGLWPSSDARFCTSDHKRGQIGTLITQLGCGIKVLNCLGMRAEESPTRAKLKPFEVNKRFSNSKRHVDQWLPIHGLALSEVWRSIHSGSIPHHYAYDLGMPRLSCIFCIFSPEDALLLAGFHNRKLLQEYADVEVASGHDFKSGFKIASLIARLDSAERIPDQIGDWRM